LSEGALESSAKSAEPEIDLTVALKSVPDQLDSCKDVEPLATWRLVTMPFAVAKDEPVARQATVRTL
jgi:hypothetical protein